MVLVLACSLWACNTAEEPSVVYIEVRFDQTKTYLVDEFDYGDFLVYGVRSNGDTFEISLSQDMLDEANLALLQTVGTQTITVNYGGQTATFTLTLSSKVPTTYTVTFNVDGGRSISPITYTLGSRYNTYNEIPTTSKEGYDLVGWRVNDALQGELISSENFVNYDSATKTGGFAITTHYTFYAIWSAKTISVSFNLCYDTSGTQAVTPASQKLVVNLGKVEKPATPVRAGYKFLAWYTSVEDVDGELIYDPADAYAFLNTVGASDFTLYAKWQRQKYTIKFNMVGGAFGSTYDETDYSGIYYNTDISSLQPDNPEKNYYTFRGWYSDAAYTELYWAAKSGQTGTPVTKVMPDGNIDLYAYWEVDNDYLLNLEMKVDGTLKVVSLSNNESGFTHIVFPAMGLYNGTRYPITEIADGVFRQKNALISFTTEENSNLKIIGARCFDYCSNLTTIELPSSVEFVGKDAFHSTKWLANWKTANPSHPNYIVVGKVLVKYLGSAQNLDMNNDTELSNVAYIATEAFTDLEHLSAITVRDSVTTIENNAFVNCAALNTINFSENSELVNLSSSAFNGTGWYNGVFADTDYFVVCNGVLYSYKGDKNVVSVTVPANVTAIGDLVFASYSQLATVNFADESKIVAVGADAFDNTQWITHAGDFVMVNDILVGVNTDGNIITVPSGVRTIASGAFKESASYVYHIVIDHAVSINEDAFADCDRLQTVSFLSSAVNLAPSSFGIVEGSFDVGASVPENLKLMVESSKLDSYKSADIWKFYGDNIYGLQVTSISVKEGTLRDVFGNDPDCDTLEEQRLKTIATLFPENPDEDTLVPVLNIVRNDGVTYECLLTIDNFYYIQNDTKTYNYVEFSSTADCSLKLTYEDVYAADSSVQYFTVEADYYIEPSLTVVRVETVVSPSALQIGYMTADGNLLENGTVEDPELTFSSLRTKYFKNGVFDPVGAVIYIEYNDVATGGGKTYTVTAYGNNTVTLVDGSDTITASLTVDKSVKANGVTLTNAGTTYAGYFFTSVIGAATDYYTYTLTFRTSTGQKIAVTNAVLDSSEFMYRVSSASYHEIQVTNLKNEFGAGEALKIRSGNSTYGSSIISLARDDGQMNNVVTNSSYLSVVTDIDTSLSFDNDGKLILGAGDTLTKDGKIRRVAVLSYSNPNNGISLTSEFEYFVSFSTLPKYFTYSYDSATNSFSITGLTAAHPSIIVVPSEFTGTVFVGESSTQTGTAPVSSIAANAFSGVTDVTAVYLPSTLTAIGNRAFYGMTALQYVRMDSSVTATLGANDVYEGTLDGETTADIIRVGDYAFADSGLVGFRIPSGLASFGAGAFSGTSDLQTVEFLMTDGACAFTTVSEAMFRNSGINSIDFAGVAIAAIRPQAFDGAAALASVLLDASLTTLTAIENSVFRNASALTSFTFVGSIESIGDYAFSNSGLISVAIPETVISIGNFAFDNTASLVDVSFGETPVLQSIGNNAFGGSAITYSSVVSSASNYTAAMSAEETAAVSGWQNYPVVLPSTLRTIGNNAFTRTANLSVVLLPSGLTDIGDYAFYSSGLCSITLPGSVTSLGEGAFMSAESLAVVYYNCVIEEYGATVALSNKLTIKEGETATATYIFDGREIVIPAYLFDGCSSLVSIITPSVAGFEYPTIIKDYAFHNCALINWRSGGTTGIDTVTFKAVGAKSFAGSGITSMASSTHLEAIGDEAFKDCYGITAINIDNSIAHLGSAIFKGCTSIASAVLDGSYKACYLFGDSGASVPYSLKTLTISDSATEIVEGAFQDFKYVQYLTFDGVDATTIGKNAFSGMTALYSATLPSTLTDVADGAFAGADSLNILVMPAHISFAKAFTTDSPGQLGTVTLSLSDDADLQYVVSHSFEGISTVSEVVLPSGLKLIGQDAFKNCTGLLSLVIPSTVKDYVPILDGATALEQLTLVVSDWNVSDLFSSTTKVPESLETLNVSEGTSALAAGSLAWLPYVKSVVLPASLLSVEQGVFTGDTALTSFEVADGNTVFHGDSGSLYAYGEGGVRKTTLVHYASATNTTYNVAASVTSIYEGAFSTALNLLSISVSNDNVHFIAASGVLYSRDKTLLVAMAANTTRSSATVNKLTVRIASYAFANCDSVKTIDVSAATDLETIGDGAFMNSGLTAFEIGSTVSHIGDRAFYGTAVSNSSLTIATGSNWFKLVNGALFMLERTGATTVGTATLLYYPSSNAEVVTYNVPTTMSADYTDDMGVTLAVSYTVGRIAPHAFAAAKITNVVFANDSESVLEISEDAFFGSTVQSITLPSRITTLANGAFLGADSLNTITFLGATLPTTIGLTVAYKTTDTFVIRVPESALESFTEAFGAELGKYVTAE